MTSAHLDSQATGTRCSYRALLAASGATVWRRDLSALFHELAGLLHQLARFDYLTLLVHDSAHSAARAAPASPGRRALRGASRLFPGSAHPQVETGFDLRGLRADRNRTGTISALGIQGNAEAEQERLRAMLRITLHDKPGGLTFQLEGRLAGPWVRVLKEWWQNAPARQRKPILRVDLTGVTFIDAAGREQLAVMHREGAKFIAADCLTKGVVAEITQAPAPDCDCGPSK